MRKPPGRQDVNRRHQHAKCRLHHDVACQMGERNGIVGGEQAMKTYDLLPSGHVPSPFCPIGGSLSLCCVLLGRQLPVCNQIPFPFVISWAAIVPTRRNNSDQPNSDQLFEQFRSHLCMHEAVRRGSSVQAMKSGPIRSTQTFQKLTSWRGKPTSRKREVITKSTIN